MTTEERNELRRLLHQAIADTGHLPRAIGDRFAEALAVVDRVPG
jgi:hypothetical protein